MKHSPRRPHRAGRIRGWMIVLIVLLVPLGWLGWALWWAVTARPNISVDYVQELIRLSAEAQPEGENGWPAFMEALTLYERMLADLGAGATDPTTGEAKVELSRMLDSAYEPEQWGPELEALAYLEQLGAFEALSRGAAAPRAVREDYQSGPLYMILLPELSLARQMARATAASMRVALREGRDDEAVEHFALTLAIARMVAAQPILISHLVGVSVEALAVRTLQRELEAIALDEATARRLMDVLRRHAETTPSIALALEGERRNVYDAIQRIYSDDGDGDGRLLYSRFHTFGSGSMARHPITNIAGFFLPGRAETTALADEIFNRFQVQASLTPAQRREFDADLDAWVENLPADQMLLRLLLPALGRSIEHENAMAVHRAGTRALLLLEIHIARHGSPPPSLDALDDDLRAMLPDDPLVSGPFGYRRFGTGEDPAGRAFMLYSFGRDGEDNGGRPAGGEFNPNDALTDRSAAGFDFVFNAPEEPEEGR